MSVAPQLSILERIARYERVLVLLAYFIELDGDVHLPLFEKFEDELEELKRAATVRNRARQRLIDAYSLEAGEKAIDSMRLSLSSSGDHLPYPSLPVR